MTDASRHLVLQLAPEPLPGIPNGCHEDPVSERVPLCPVAKKVGPRYRAILLSERIGALHQEVKANEGYVVLTNGHCISQSPVLWLTCLAPGNKESRIWNGSPQEVAERCA